jgi:hypothetical protein
MTIFVEDWQPNYGSPYLVQPDDGGTAEVTLVEDRSELRFHRVSPSPPSAPVAFVDGVRRGEAALYQSHPKTFEIARGVAGGHACGAVIADTEGPPFFDRERVRRLVIWGSGLRTELPEVAGGWIWESASIADSAPDAPLKELQTRMRQDEGRLAEELSAEGCLVLIDGPLYFVRSRDLPVVGYVKTHHRALLPPELHRKIPDLAPSERTSLFALGQDRYSCYLRLTSSRSISGPWAGIVRIEIPQSAGLAACVELADRVAQNVPRFAGVPHRDPRAPQNLQPLGALENHLRHLLGDPGLANRAVRDAAYVQTWEAKS